jgi:hypothetical protein
VEYGIQRGSICLLPPGGDDVDYVCRAFDEPAIYQSLGLGAPSGAEIRARHRLNSHVFGIIHELTSRTRIGFVIIFPPTEAFDAWSFLYAIPEERHRNAFAALHSADAMAHYMFDHLRIDALGWETREGKTAADAVVRRLGYRAVETKDFAGKSYRFYRITREEWMKRRRKIENNATGPSFAKLTPPYYSQSLSVERQASTWPAPSPIMP